MVVARDGRDARQQVAAKGLSNVSLLSEQTTVDTPLVAEGWDLDEAAIAEAGRAMEQGITALLLKALGWQWWLWLPPLALLAHSIYQGGPFGWGDYLIFGYMAVALAAVLLLLAPMALYDAEMRARVSGRWSTALALTKFLARLPNFGVMPNWWAPLEEATIEAARGNDEKAHEIWELMAGDVDEDVYWQGRVQIHDHAADTDRKLEALRQFLALLPGDPMRTVDLAMALAHHVDHVDEAEGLLLEVNRDDLAELALVAHDHTQGLIALGRGDAASAMALFQAASSRLEGQYAGVPLVAAFQVEIQAFMAIALRRLAQEEQAQSVWGQVWPRLSFQRGARRYQEQFEQAGAG
ncbi:MAG: hypothetical protein AAGE01_07060 [Pseudomonadota bacterium]